MKEVLCVVVVMAMASFAWAGGKEPAPSKPSASEVVKVLEKGNGRFLKGRPKGPNRNKKRIALAATSNQGDFALATILSCSDSRVPVELLFDAGIMDLFVVRVAGNVADTDEIGTIEYGLAHVRTPLLVVLGHSDCGAVKAVNAAVHGKGHALEKNIPPLVDNISPAVKRAIAAHPNAEDSELLMHLVEENVWQSIHDIFMRSATTRQLVAENKVRVVGAIYDLATGRVNWLDEQKPQAILAQVNEDPARDTEPMAGEEGSHGANAAH